MQVFETKRLYIKKAEATEKDIENYYRLWNSGEVMKMVGFPEGLGISRQEIHEQFEKLGKTEFDSCLAVHRKEDDKFIGECKLGLPNEKHISTTDVKLLSEFWGNNYGKEIKAALCDYLFTKTDCKIVEASPNKLNLASQKMQKYCGGKIVREELFEAPKNSKVVRTDVKSYIYHIKKEDFYDKTTKKEESK